MVKQAFGILFTAFVLVFMANAVFAQETTGNIEGTVQDPTGAVVPNITITLTNSGSSGVSTTGTGAGFRRTLTSNGEGAFRAIQIPPG